MPLALLALAVGAFGIGTTGRSLVLAAISAALERRGGGTPAPRENTAGETSAAEPPVATPATS